MEKRASPGLLEFKKRYFERNGSGAHQVPLRSPASRTQHSPKNRRRFGIHANKIFDSMFKNWNEQESPSELLVKEISDKATQNHAGLLRSFDKVMGKIQAEAQREYEKIFYQYDFNVNRYQTEHLVYERFYKDFDTCLSNVFEPFLIELLAIIWLNMRSTNEISLFDVQMIAGLKLYRKTILEMKTGEGKTFVIPIAAVLFSLRAKLINIFLRKFVEANKLPQLQPNDRLQVVVVTANDYLARRDYTLLHEFYGFFHISAFYIQDNASNSGNRTYYEYDVIYSTCSHMCHLSLRDMTRSEFIPPHLPTYNYCAILDEIDQILLDEALTPHVISEGESSKDYEIDIIYQANRLARMLSNDFALFRYDASNDLIELTPTGLLWSIEKLDKFLSEFESGFNPDQNLSSIRNNVLEINKCWISDTADIGTLVKQICLEVSYFDKFIRFIHRNLKDIWAEIIPLYHQILKLAPQYDFLNEYSNNVKFFPKAPPSIRDLITEVAWSIAQFVAQQGIKERELQAAIVSEILFIAIERREGLQSNRQLEQQIKYWLALVNLALNRTKLANKPLSKVLFDLIQNDIPSILSNFDPAKAAKLKESIAFDLKHTSRFLVVRDNRLELIPKIKELMHDQQGWKRYFEDKFANLKEFNPSRVQNLMGYMIKLGPVQFEYTYYYYTRECLESLSKDSQETDSDLLTKLRKLLEDFITSLGSSGFNLLTEESGKSDLKKLVKDIEDFLPNEAQRPEAIHAFFRNIKKLDELDSENVKNMIDEVKGFQTKMGSITSFEEFRRGMGSYIGAIMFHLLEMKEKSYDPVFYNHVHLGYAVAMTGIQVCIGDTIFSELKESTEDTILFVKSNEELSGYYSDYLIGKVTNPFAKLQGDLKVLSTNGVAPCIRFIQNAIQQNTLIPIDHDSWWISTTYFRSTSLLDFLKTRRLLDPVRDIAAGYLKRLKKNNLGKRIGFSQFLVLVQRAFDSNLFYNNNQDYILSKIDASRNPHKIKFDKYTERNTTDEILIINQITGRSLVSNRWSGYLHSMVEAKESLLVLGESDAQSQVTPQSYFGGYLHLSGLSGTTIVARQEFKQKFGLDVLPIPTNVPIQRRKKVDKIYFSEKSTINGMILEAYRRYCENGGPVLIILDSINNCQYALKGFLHLQEKIKVLESKVQEEGEEFRKMLLHLQEKIAELESKAEETKDGLKKVREVKGELFSVIQFHWKKWFEHRIKDKNLFGGEEYYLGNQAQNLDMETFEEFSMFIKSFNALDIVDYGWETEDPRFLQLCMEIILGKSHGIPMRIEVLDGSPQKLSQESEIIKRAGYQGSILISTRVAGRGTDIKLIGEGAKENGLQILIYNHQESLRHDQQIFGRCGRQGDKGEYQFFNAFETGLNEVLQALAQQIGSENLEAMAALLTIQSYVMQSEPVNEGNELDHTLPKKAAVENNESFHVDIENDFSINTIVRQFQLRNEFASQMKRIYEKVVGDICIIMQREIMNPSFHQIKWNQNAIEYQKIRHLLNDQADLSSQSANGSHATNHLLVLFTFGAKLLDQYNDGNLFTWLTNTIKFLSACSYSTTTIHDICLRIIHSFYPTKMFATHFAKVSTLLDDIIGEIEEMKGSTGIVGTPRNFRFR
jgi:preprotein translocase subunit SecA